MWLLIPILFYCIIYYYIRHIHTCWKRRGFPSEKSGLTPTFLLQLYKREFHLTKALSAAYVQGRERFMGIYMLFRPILLVRNITLAKDILENAERCFQDTTWNYMHIIKKMYYFEKIKMALTKNMYEDMFESIEKSGDNMLEHLTENWPAQGNVITVDIEKTIGTYTKDIIGKLFYGLDMDSFKFPFNIFHQEFKNVQQHCSFRKFITTNKLRKILEQTIKQREERNLLQEDILQILIQIRNSQYLRSNREISWKIEVVTEREKSLTVGATVKLTEELTSLLLEAITNITVLTIYEVSQQPSVLAKILKEIKDVLKNHALKEDQLSFDAVQDLVYTQLCIKETLRKYPPVPLIKRRCCKNYRIPSSRHVLDAGYNVYIPVQEIQRDEQYFTEPLLYKPERFMTINEQKWSSAYIPFGLGAKAEIAETLTILLVKVALTKLLLTFDLESSQLTAGVVVKRSTKLNLKRKRISLKL